MKDYTVNQNETLRLTVTTKESGAQTAELVAIKGEDSFTKTATFDGLVADLSMNIPANQAPGDYEYYIRIVWSDGTADVLKKTSGCTGKDDCPMPIITVCELPEVGS